MLTEPLLALIASRECPGHVFLEIVERVPQWIQTKKVIISGFHSPLEQQVLRSLLRRKGRAIKVLARSFAHESADYRPTPEEREALNSGQMLVITAFPPTVTRITRATALERNRLVLALAQEHYIPYLSAQSPLRSFLTNRDQEHAQEA
ncbi:hypothetical protein AGMMS49960_11040 [Betaproteobacteria bacterium]|nr:hypothetical protein AGMMS49543_09070 [Betaproteobacteria bacterium]GHU01229.1 hypothetical protein AGMMS49960_11040 [Betaproteobacteria bacterium]GHU17189.1 hypothetical protein AGMMS50243_04990 [Betaproteobacteria bacterium]